MKSQILKIAGVKSEAAFYKKYPTEAAFFKAHPEAKSIKKAQSGYYNATNTPGSPNYFGQSFGPQNQWNFGSNMSSTPSFGAPSTQQMAGNTFQSSGNPFAMQNYGQQFMQNNPAIQKGIGKISNGVFGEDKSVTGGLGGKDYKGEGSSAISPQMVAGIAGAIPGIFNAFAAERKQKKSLQQQEALLKPMEELSKSTDVNDRYQKHVLDRPENYTASTNMFYPSQGTGYDILRGVGRDGLNIQKAQEGFVEGMGKDSEGYDYYDMTDSDIQPIKQSPKIDSKSARDNWVAKTGLPWSEAKRLGYTTGSAKDNTKLLSELNDPRFKKENLRSTPPKNSSQSRTPVQHRETPTGRLAPIKKPIQSYEDFFKGKPKYKGSDAMLSTDKRNQTQREEEAKRSQAEYDDYLLGERPLYYMAHPSKAFGDFKSVLNPSGTREDETSEAFRKEVMANRYNPNKTDKQRILSHIKKGLKLTPKAALNAATLLSGLPEVSYEAFPTAIGEGAGSRAAGYLGQGAKQLGQAAPRMLNQPFTPNFVMYKDGGEISNTFAPGTLYDDLDQVKQYADGGDLEGAAGGGMDIMGPINSLGSNLIGAGYNNNAGFQAAGALAPLADMAFPGAGLALQLVGGGLDQAFGDAGKINKLTQSNANTQQRIMDNSMWKNMGQFGSVRKEGGWVSNDWNPQVIAMFGDHTAEDFADYAHKYRAGGHLKEYTPPSERAMETYADGGELKTHWGGNLPGGEGVKPVSYNPYSEGEGLTYNAYGNSHFQKDEQGRTGIGLSIMKDGGDMGDEPDVEIETNEPISITNDGAVVYGNLNTNKDLLEQFQLPEKYANKKVKHVVNNIIVPQEKKYTGELEKITSDVPKSNTAIGALGDKTKEVQTLGLNMKLKQLAKDKENLAAYQDHIHQTTDFLTNLLGKEVSQEKFAKNGEVSHTLAKGELSQVAKNGKTIKAQDGTYAVKGTLPGSIDYNAPDTAGDIFKGSNYETQWGPKRDKAFSDPTIAKQLISDLENYSGQDAEDVKAVLNKEKTMSGKIAKAYELASDKKVGPYHTILNSIIDKNATPAVAPTITPTPTKPAATELEAIEETPKKGFPWASAASSLIRGLYPAFNMPLGNQINPELYALANNQVEGLAENHMYSMLKTPYKYSADKDRNAVLSQAREAVKNSGNNPAAQSAIMASVADAMNQIGSKEFEINQQGYQGVYNDNINTVNQDRARNLGIDMDAANKLAQAKSNTKATTEAALTSLYAKEAANKKENMEYNIGMAEHPDYTFGPDGRIIKLPRYIDFDTTGKGVASGTKGKGLAAGKEFSYDSEGNIIGVHSKGKKSTARDGKTIKNKNLNSNIVKAFKNL